MKYSLTVTNPASRAAATLAASDPSTTLLDAGSRGRSR